MKMLNLVMMFFRAFGDNDGSSSDFVKSVYLFFCHGKYGAVGVVVVLLLLVIVAATALYSVEEKEQWSELAHTEKTTGKRGIDQDNGST
jgi:hypothetical protein